MTPEEQASKIVEAVIDGYQITRHPWSEGLIALIERAIIIAVEEDRKTRECCKSEREACATIAEEEAIHWAFSPAKATEHFKHITQVIRARSQGQGKPSNQREP